MKRLAAAVLPVRLFQRLSAMMSRRYQLRMLQTSGIVARTKRYIEKHGTVVQAGPFLGLIYPLDAALSRVSTPKLLGSYEQELHPTLRLASERAYECVIDIGSAEGYYAVGLARMLRVPVYAYEPEPREKAYSAQMAELNGVTDLIQMGDLFTVEDMRRFAGSRALVICDCEGFEEELFRADTVQLTSNWDVVIELHENTDTALPSLSWPQKISVISLNSRNGLQDEYRSTRQRLLWCDSRA